MFNNVFFYLFFIVFLVALSVGGLFIIWVWRKLLVSLGYYMAKGTRKYLDEYREGDR